ncbi:MULTISPECIES: pyrroloquinoline quinone precursor peptide PqqA [unclassified Streptomyces]|uniref:pyrroloquinoline quinone precursor peptide PqqA n=1 Tax=unclassified Streptomyces TaxID=2593676 RepID=UPI0037F1AB85
MNDATEHAPRTPEIPQHPLATPSGDQAAWQTPDYTVIETALEVTAYSLTAR